MQKRQSSQYTYPLYIYNLNLFLINSILSVDTLNVNFLYPFHWMGLFPEATKNSHNVRVIKINKSNLSAPSKEPPLKGPN